MTAPDVTGTGEQIERLLTDLAAAGDPRVSETAEDLVRLLVRLYGAGLARIVDLIGEHVSDPTTLARLFANDELVSNLLVLHGLHPFDVRQRVEQALRGLGDQGAGLRLVEVDDDGVAHLEFVRSGCGCATAMALDQVERAIANIVADLTAVRIREAVKPAQLIPSEALFRDRAAVASS